MSGRRIFPVGVGKGLSEVLFGRMLANDGHVQVGTVSHCVRDKANWISNSDLRFFKPDNAFRDFRNLGCKRSAIHSLLCR